MAILILHKPQNFSSDYFQWLRELGTELVVFTANPSFKSKEAYYLVKFFVDYDDSNLVELEAIELNKSCHFTHVIALYEEDIIRAARIREYLGIEGQNYKSAIAYRNKVAMKNHLASTSINVPFYKELESSLDLVDFVSLNNYPVVIKPISGSSGTDTTIIKNKEQLHDYLAHEKLQGKMVESFVKGQMYSVNGIYKDGNIVFCSVNKYEHGCLAFQNQEGDFITLISPTDKLFIRAKNLTNEIISYLPTPNAICFHCELFYSLEDNEFYFCEIASRPGGGRITASIHASYGIELYESTARLLAGLPLTDNFSHNPSVLSAVYLIPKKRGVLLSVIHELPFDWVVEYTNRVRQGMKFIEGTSCMDIIGSVVFIADTYADLYNRYNLLLAYINANIQWEYCCNGNESE
ncbi:ATP-grasp domain-containing protein [Paenibacillus humicus]|uniref:ATP-grasp domain-containing protein n=1 Tax=Paenibacillus humicus TaxID=412861 RepID=UPI003D26E921